MHVVVDAVADVQQGAGVVDRGRGDVRDARQAEQERRGQRALVEGAEDHRAVDVERADLGGEGVDVGVVDRLRLRVDPRGAPLDPPVDAGEERCRAAPAGAVEERDGAGAVGEGADGGAGEEDVAVVVEAYGQDVGHAAASVVSTAGSVWGAGTRTAGIEEGLRSACAVARTAGIDEGPCSACAVARTAGIEEALGGGVAVRGGHRR